jgi:enoyl-CoA hydratase
MTDPVLTDAVLTEFADGVAVVTINRPEARNAVNKAVAEGIAAAMDEIERRDDVTVAVLTGTGGTFSAGMDLKAFMRGELPEVPGRGFGGLVAQPPSKPLIAAVEGYALAGGCELALAADMIVAARTAKFGLPEVKRGLVAGAGGLFRLPRRVPRAIAMEIVLTGEFIDAERAYAIGLVNRLADQGSALTDALALAQTIAANGPLALRVSKSIMQQSADWSDAESFERQAPQVGPVFASEDAQEGALAFAEKRPPVWRGK